MSGRLYESDVQGDQFQDHSVAALRPLTLDSMQTFILMR